MKYLIIAVVVGCGFKPSPPAGCTYGDAVCVCDESGYCHWTWVCEE